MSKSDNDTEIAQIEHELSILKNRQRLLERTGRTLRLGFYLTAAVSLVLGIYSLDKKPDALPIFIIMFLASLASIVVLHIWRPTDLVSRRFFFAEKRSEAEAVEDMIAERENRLANLRSPPTL
jgi:hypothetical protein